jgi:hypothetical protein
LINHFLGGVLAILLVGATLRSQALAVCTTLVRGPVAIAVSQCKTVAPEMSFKGDSKYAFIKDLPPTNRSKFLSTYRGSLIWGTVTQSQAIRQGISDEKGALLNEKITAFVPVSQSSCNAILGKLIEVDLRQSCCDGGGVSPCLLDTGYVLSKIKVSELKASKSSAKRSAEAQAIYAKVKQAVIVKDYRKASGLLEQLRTKGELDVQGQFQLAALYREMDKCTQGVVVLEPLYERFEKKDYWTDTEAPIRKGAFLYARCLSVLSRASEATLVLQGFLVEPQKFRKEIRDSLSHRDFGYIKTSKPWAKYSAAAQKALSMSQGSDENGQAASNMFGP